MKRSLHRLFAVALGALFALVAVDLFMRWTDAAPLQRNPLSGFHRTDRELGWLGTPDFRARFRRPEFDVVIETGPDGFRRPALDPMELDPGAPRVAFLGDSFTWGWGVEQGEVFTDHLRLLAGGSLDVRNCGVNAFGTGQQLLLLERLSDTTQIDQAVVVFFGNDLKDNTDPKGGKRPWFRLEGDDLVRENQPVRRGVAGAWRELWRRSPALSMLRFQANEVAAALEAAVEEPEAEPARTEQTVREERWRVQIAILTELRAFCAQRGIRLRVLGVPGRAEVEPSEGDDRASQTSPVARLGEVSERLGIEYLDLTAPLRARAGEAEGALYYPQDGHWTEDGHRAVAEVLHESWFGG